MEDLELAAQSYPIFEPLWQGRQQFVARFQREIDLVYWPAYKFSETGVNFYQSCYVVSLLSIFLLSLVMNLIRVPFLRKAFSTVLGIFFGFYVNGFAMWWCHLPSVLVYIVMATMKREHAFVVCNLSAAGILLYGSWVELSSNMGLTHITFFTCNMFLFIRLNMLLTNYRDAGQLDLKDCKLSTRERYYAEPLKNGPPGLLNMINYTNFLVSSSCGSPALEYRDMMEYLDVKGQSQDVPAMECLANGFKTMVFACLTCVAGRIIASRFPAKYVWEESDTDFHNEPLWW